jgi:hypothetical protein
LESEDSEAKTLILTGFITSEGYMNYTRQVGNGEKVLYLRELSN